MNKKYSSISLRLEKNLDEKIKKVSEYEDLEKSIIYRQAIRKGIKEILKELAIKKYIDEDLSTSESANFADMYIGDFMDLLRKRGIKRNLSLEYLEKSDKNTKNLFKNITKLNSPKKK